VGVKKLAKFIGFTKTECVYLKRMETYVWGFIYFLTRLFREVVLDVKECER